MPRYIHPHSLVPWEWLYHATIYIHPHSLVPWEWLYHAKIYPPPLSSSMGEIISCHDISTPTLYFHGSDYIMPQYIHPHSLVPWEWLYYATIYQPHSLVTWEWLYHATIYPLPLSNSMWVIALCGSMSSPLSSCMGITIMIIMPWCISTRHKIWDWL